MQIELEAKFLDIDPDKIRALLKKHGATLVHEERLMRRITLDYPDTRLRKVGGWVRLRDEGDKITLAYKQLVDRTIEGTKEVSFVVDNFESSTNFLLAVGLAKKSYQETKRERWDLGGVEVTIDTWPWIPTFVEIEGASETKLRDAADKLGLDWSKAMHGSVETAYQAYYQVSEDDVNSWESMTFSPVPSWLEARR